MNLPPSLLPTGETAVTLPSGKVVYLPMCNPGFVLWKGQAVDFKFGGKPLIDYKGEAIFAEIVILRLLLAAGWDGVWVETYGGMNFIKDMPKDWKLSPQNLVIPEDKKQIISLIQKNGKTRACFDIFAWKGNDILFCEAKNKGKDRLTPGQLKFIEGALSCGISPQSLLIVEWNPV